MFLGLSPGMYKLSVPSVAGTFTPTLLNTGSDVTDADDDALVDQMNVLFGIVLPLASFATAFN